MRTFWTESLSLRDKTSDLMEKRERESGVGNPFHVFWATGGKLKGCISRENSGAIPYNASAVKGMRIKIYCRRSDSRKRVFRPVKVWTAVGGSVDPLRGKEEKMTLPHNYLCVWTNERLRVTPRGQARSLSCSMQLCKLHHQCLGWWF